MATRKESIARAQAIRLAMPKRQRDAGGFTPVERLFILHYLGAANRNATEAAQLAGRGKSRVSSRQYAHKLMQQPHIIAEIQRLTEERNERLGVTVEDVLRRLLVIEADATSLGVSVQSLRLRREVVKDIGDHVAVGAFRRQVGLSNPAGGPIETTDTAWLASVTDEELDALERARAIIDRRSGGIPAMRSARDDDQGGEGEAPEGD